MYCFTPSNSESSVFVCSSNSSRLRKTITHAYHSVSLVLRLKLPISTYSQFHSFGTNLFSNQQLGCQEGDHMDWYFGRDVDYLIPMDREPPNPFASPDYMLQRAATTFKNFGFPNKYCVQATKSSIKELNFHRQHLNHEVNKKSSVPGAEGTCGLTTSQESSLVNYGGGNLEASLQRTGHSDQMDDILLSSLLDEDPPQMENPYRTPINTLPEFECSATSFDNLLTDMIMDPHSISRESSGTGNFPQSMIWENMDCTSEYFMLSDTGQNKCSLTTKPPGLSVLIPAELETSQEEIGYVDKETSLEAMVLQELQVVMTQMTQKTRICFRDALYRLAQCSKQQNLLSLIQNGEIAKETLRAGGIKQVELETNTIDRTIAGLLFNKPNCNQLDLSFVEYVNTSPETVSTHESYNHSLKHAPMTPHHHPVLSRDAKVPIFGIEQNSSQFVSY